MKVTQIRNATIIIQSGENVILVDPMLAPKGAIPSLKYVTRNRRRNPLVDLPKGTEQLLEKVTHCLITHCQKGHFDHLDRKAINWLRERKLPVYCSEQDAEYLKKKGLNIHHLKSSTENSFLDGKVKLIPCIHGKGVIGKFMAHGYGYFIQLPKEPSLYITGDTILTEDVKTCIHIDQPEVILFPAGGARLDLGNEIIMGLDEAIQIGSLASGKIIANHLEALDHCPVSRTELTKKLRHNGWEKRFFVPEDGETLNFENSTLRTK